MMKNNNIPFLNLKDGYIELKNDLDESFDRVMNSGYYILSEEVNLFESEYAEFCDSNYCVGGELVNEFKKLLGINFDQYYEILKTTNQRRNMTNFLMNYFEFHISGFKRPNSLEILNGLFS